MANIELGGAKLVALMVKIFLEYFKCVRFEQVLMKRDVLMKPL